MYYSIYIYIINIVYFLHTHIYIYTVYTYIHSVCIYIYSTCSWVFLTNKQNWPALHYCTNSTHDKLKNTNLPIGKLPMFLVVSQQNVLIYGWHYHHEQIACFQYFSKPIENLSGHWNRELPFLTTFTRQIRYMEP